MAWNTTTTRRLLGIATLGLAGLGYALDSPVFTLMAAATAVTLLTFSKRYHREHE